MGRTNTCAAVAHATIVSTLSTENCLFTNRLIDLHRSSLVFVRSVSRNSLFYLLFVSVHPKASSSRSRKTIRPIIFVFVLVLVTEISVELQYLPLHLPHRADFDGRVKDSDCDV